MQKAQSSSVPSVKTDLHPSHGSSFSGNNALTPPKPAAGGIAQNVHTQFLQQQHHEVVQISNVQMVLGISRLNRARMEEEEAALRMELMERDDVGSP
jgi:hypothetical protein